MELCLSGGWRRFGSLAGGTPAELAARLRHARRLGLALASLLDFSVEPDFGFCGPTAASAQPTLRTVLVGPSLRQCQYCQRFSDSDLPKNF